MQINHYFFTLYTAMSYNSVYSKSIKFYHCNFLNGGFMRKTVLGLILLFVSTSSFADSYEGLWTDTYDLGSISMMYIEKISSTFGEA